MAHNPLGPLSEKEYFARHKLLRRILFGMGFLVVGLLGAQMRAAWQAGTGVVAEVVEGSEGAVQGLFAGENLGLTELQETTAAIQADVTNGFAVVLLQQALLERMAQHIDTSPAPVEAAEVSEAPTPPESAEAPPSTDSIEPQVTE